MSAPVYPNGGILQAARLAPLLFAKLFDRLASSWPYRVKYVNDATVVEIIPWCSPSYLPCVASHVSRFAAERVMRLKPKKSREMVINLLQNQPAPLNAPQLMGSVIRYTLIMFSRKPISACTLSGYLGNQKCLLKISFIYLFILFIYLIYTR